MMGRLKVILLKNIVIAHSTTVMLTPTILIGDTFKRKRLLLDLDR